MLIPIGFFEGKEKYYYTEFDGVNEYINCGNDTSLSFDNTDAFSYSAWVNTSSISPLDIIFHRYLSNTGITIRLISNVVHVLINDDLNPPSSGGFTFFKSTTILNINEWYHIVVTKNSIGANVINFNIYINGSIDVKIAITDTLTSSMLVNTNLEIGGRSELSGIFDGSIDEVSVNGSELTASNVLDNYNLGRKNPTLPTYGSLISHWRMDTLNPIDEQGINNGTSINMDSSNIIEWS